MKNEVFVLTDDRDEHPLKTSTSLDELVNLAQTLCAEELLDARDWEKHYSIKKVGCNEYKTQ